MAALNSFSDYFYLLLPSALKKVGEKSNRFWTLCKVLGRQFDECKAAILSVREHSMLLSCAPDILPVSGHEREMPRLKSEEVDPYRRRLVLKRIVAEQAGTNPGIVSAVRSLGHDTVWIEPIYMADPERWAEANVWIDSGALVLEGREAIRQTLNDIKPASALLHLSHEYVQAGESFVGVQLVRAKIIELSEV